MKNDFKLYDVVELIPEAAHPNHPHPRALVQERYGFSCRLQFFDPDHRDFYDDWQTVDMLSKVEYSGSYTQFFKELP